MTLMVGVSVAHAAGKVTVTTPYPAVAVAPGTKVSFDLSIETDVASRVDLKVERVPTGWTANLFGGGFVVDGVQSDGSKATTVRLDVTLPAEATAATQRIEVVATAGGATDRLPLDIRITPAAAGSVSLTTDFPQLKGTSTTAFSFNLTLHNDTAEDLTVRRDRDRPVRLDRDGAGQLGEPGRERHRQGRQHDPGHREGDGRRPTSPRAPIRSPSTSRAAAERRMRT